eukprot:5472533-Amphidinium_carterae.1
MEYTARETQSSGTSLECTQNNFLQKKSTTRNGLLSKIVAVSAADEPFQYLGLQFAADLESMIGTDRSGWKERYDRGLQLSRRA